MGTNSQKRQRTQDNERPAIRVGYGKLVKLHRDRAGPAQQELAEAVGHSCEQVASIEQGRRPVKSAFARAAETVPEAGGNPAVLHDDIGALVTEPDKVSECWLRCGTLRSQALNIEESARLIGHVMGELRATTGP